MDKLSQLLFQGADKCNYTGQKQRFEYRGGGLKRAWPAGPTKTDKESLGPGGEHNFLTRQRGGFANHQSGDNSFVKRSGPVGSAPVPDGL